MSNFQSTSEMISIHALREERDPALPQDEQVRLLFQSTRSARSATLPLPGPPLSARFQSTRSARSATRTWARGLPALLISIHALREERDPRCRLFHRAIKISIHALREERDLWLGPFLWRIQVISIHALREERDQFVAPRLISNFEFQSTRSARSATKRALDKMVGSGISIHALREERDDPMLWEALKEEISIHALREERDSIPELFSIYTDEFQSTRSARSATCVNSRRDGDSSSISIHALREERDNQQGWADKGGNISIHALREERDGAAGRIDTRGNRISIHALREERDL